VSVRIRMKQLGRKHRPYYRICAMDIRAPRNGRILEELGTYDPMIPETDARAMLNGERIDYWLGQGAQPSEKVKVLIKKYGTAGTHKDLQRAALSKLAMIRRRPEPPAAASRAGAEAAAEAAEEPVADENAEENKSLEN
jgi:small subunit ribosomal protein S16